MHPRRLRCSSLKYSRYSRSSRLAGGAPRPSRCDARLSPRAANAVVLRAIQGDLLVAAAGRAIIICRDAQMTNISRPRSRRSAQYPLASIAPYGPDNTFATKLVVSVVERPGHREPSTMRTWTTQAVDV